MKIKCENCGIIHVGTFKLKKCVNCGAELKHDKNKGGKINDSKQK